LRRRSSGAPADAQATALRRAASAFRPVAARLGDFLADPAGSDPLVRPDAGRRIGTLEVR
jgi:hypothetical protein